jgi:hypothetical protein
MKSLCWIPAALILHGTILAAAELALPPSAPSTGPSLAEASSQPPAPERKSLRPPRLAAPRLAGRRVFLPATQSRAEFEARQVQAGKCESCGDSADAGYIETIARNFLDDVAWTELPDGSHVLKMEFESRNCGGLRAKFRGELPAGIELRAYDLDGNVTEPFDPAPQYREESDPPRKAEKTWWAPTIYGEIMGLEFYCPPGHRVPHHLPRVVKMAYLFNDAAGQGADGTSGMELACHLDVSCFPAFANEATAVARLMWPAEEAGRVKFCSGALLTRSPADFAPIFMTAAHCIHRQEDANAVEFLWLFQRSSCNGALAAMNTFPRTHGALILKLHINADWSLLGLFEPPPVNFYLGWDAGNTSTWAADAPATSISHPRGTHKRIAFTRKGGDSSRPFDLGTGIIPVIHVWDINFSEGMGVVEPGSSGSPILDAQRRVRGTLTGSYSFPGCPPITYHYGRLEYAWSTVNFYLNNMATPTHVDGQVAGDNNNEGSNERGTSSNPFNTLREATYCVRSGDEVRLSQGNYNEQFKIWRPMKLTAIGGNAHIGSP